jgi:uncharacterized membrane protein HdeD (DUF308 family)
MNIAFGLLFLIVGIVSLIYAIKSPIEDDELFLNSTNFKWIMSSLCSILIGFYLLFNSME